MLPPKPKRHGPFSFLLKNFIKLLLQVTKSKHGRMAAAALASLKAVAADCFSTQAGFGAAVAASDLVTVDKLRAFYLPLERGRAAAPSATRLALAAEPAPLTFLQLPPEVLVLVFCRLDARSLAHVAVTCSGLYRDPPRPMTPVEEALLERAAACGHVSRDVCPMEPPRGRRTLPGLIASATGRGRQWRVAPTAPSLWRRAGAS